MRYGRQTERKYFFVKYTRLNRKGQPGIVRVSKDGSWRTYVNDDYLYWHCYPSVDKQWVAADTQIAQSVRKLC